jgi:hypothetical protein
VERNAIAVLSDYYSAIDAPSETWLGRSCPCERIRRSGMWNSDHLIPKRFRTGLGSRLLTQTCSEPISAYRGEMGEMVKTETGFTETVPLHDPVKFEPPPPFAPPVTNVLKAWPFVLLKPSGVPACSPFGYPAHVLPCEGLTLKAL